MKKSATIEDVKKAKIALEGEVLSKITAFEKDYGVRLSYISIHRKRSDKVKNRPEILNDGPPVSVDIYMDLDVS